MASDTRLSVWASATGSGASSRSFDKLKPPLKRLPGHPWRGAHRQSASPFVFASERGSPFTPSGFAKLLARVGDEAKIGFKVHPHMLRHACGYALANKGIDTRTLQAYLGHRSINSTTRYAALAPGRFKNIWGRI
jgi:site-specific recombinase XerD